MTRATHHAPGARGFTLLEVIVVVMILAIVSATAVPAFNFQAAGRRAAVAAEIQSTLEQCRSLSMAEGTPMGLSIDIAIQRVMRQVILTPGAQPTTPLTSDGRVDEGYLVHERFPGVLLESFSNGDGRTSSFSAASTPMMIWFSFDGTPQSRDAAGVLGGAWMTDAAIEVRGGQTVRVSRVTGVITR